MTQKEKKSRSVSKKKLYCKKWKEVHSVKLDTEHYVQPKSEAKRKGQGKLGGQIQKQKEKNPGN